MFESAVEFELGVILDYFGVVFGDLSFVDFWGISGHGEIGLEDWYFFDWFLVVGDQRAVFFCEFLYVLETLLDEFSLYVVDHKVYVVPDIFHLQTVAK